MSQPSNKNHHGAIAAYASQSKLAVSYRDGVCASLRFMIRNLQSAREEYRMNKLDKMCDHTQKNFMVLVLLQKTVNVDEKVENAVEATAASEFLKNSYRDCFTKLANILREPSVEAEFERQISLFKSIIEGFRQRDEVSGTASLPAETKVLIAAV